MSSLLICSTPVHGHVTPLLTVARELVARGHRVRFLSGRRYRDAIAATGAQWIPLSEDADYDDRDMDAAFPGRRGRSGIDGIRWDLREIFLRPAPVQLADVDAAIAAEPVDAVLAESMFAGAMLLLHRRGPRPPVVNLGIVPLGVRSRDTAPFGLGIVPRAGAAGRVRNTMLALLTDRVIFGGLNRYARDLVAGCCGGDASRASFFTWPQRADALVQFTVAEFEYPRTDLPGTVHFVGPLPSGGGAPAPLPQWWGELEDGRPLVLVTQGTVANRDPGALITPTVAGLADEDVHVIVATGGGPGPDVVPANTRVVDYIPFDIVMPRASVFVTNGGYGGVHHALARGVPLVVSGRTEDKIEVTARVAWTGVGVDLHVERPDASSVRAAVMRVLREPSYRARSAQLQAAIAAAPGIDGVVSVVDALVQGRRAAETASGGR